MSSLYDRWCVACKQHACCVHVGDTLVSCSAHTDVKNVGVSHVVKYGGVLCSMNVDVKMLVFSM